MKNPPAVKLRRVVRRERDSNPRKCDLQRFSRPPHSTALPSLRRKSKVTGFLDQKNLVSAICLSLFSYADAMQIAKVFTFISVKNIFLILQKTHT
jgi:hypothetical protein